jgi:hypothetical protein
LQPLSFCLVVPLNIHNDRGVFLPAGNGEKTGAFLPFAYPLNKPVCKPSVFPNRLEPHFVSI